jgi:DnaK suppressor protein
MTTDVGMTQHPTVHTPQSAQIRRRSDVNGVDNQLFGDADLAVLRTNLQEHRRFRLQQLGEIARGSSGGASRAGSTPHIEVSRKLAAAARMALEEIEAALAKMNTGRYGRCSRCGRAISVELLWSYPQAPYCTACHRVMRRTQ